MILYVNERVLFFKIYVLLGDFTGGPVVKNLPANAEDTGLIPGQGGFTCQGATKPMSHNY